MVMLKFVFLGCLHGHRAAVPVTQEGVRRDYVKLSVAILGDAVRAYWRSSDLYRLHQRRINALPSIPFLADSFARIRL
jgi:hypothetical protein